MHKMDRSTRLIVVGGALIALAVALWMGFVLISVYYFWANEEIPGTIDLVQRLMLLSAAASGAAGVILSVLYVIRIFSSRGRRYQGPPADR